MRCRGRGCLHSLEGRGSMRQGAWQVTPVGARWAKLASPSIGSTIGLVGQSSLLAGTKFAMRSVRGA